MKKKILVLAPHPDDEVLGCFGAISDHLVKGDAVDIVYMSYGESGDGSVPRARAREIRTREARKVMEYLGITAGNWLGLPDGRFCCDSNSTGLLRDIIARLSPDCIYTPHGKEAHRDHRTTHKIALAAIKSFQSLNNDYAVELRCYEVWTPLPRFNRVLDISAVIHRKKECIRGYRSQLEHLGYDEAIPALNRYRGIMTTKGDYCEVYDCFRLQTPGLERIKGEDIYDFLP